VSFLIDLQPSAGPALVVGAGTVALRRITNLAAAGFDVTVIAAAVDAASAALAAHPAVTVVQRAFSDTDIDGPGRWALVFACTDDRDVNRRAGELARAHGIPVAVADARAESTFFTPATAREGAVTIAVSTGGGSPGFAKDLRDRIATALGEGWGATAGTLHDDRAARRGLE